MGEIKGYYVTQLKKMSEREREIVRILQTFIKDIKYIFFIYERKKPWKIIIKGNNFRYDIPFSQFSINDKERLMEELKKYMLAISICRTPLFVDRYTMKIFYKIVVSEENARNLAMNYIRKIFRNNLDLIVENSFIEIPANKIYDELKVYITKINNKKMYKFRKISISAGFLSYDIMVGAMINIIPVRNKIEHNALLEVLKEFFHLK